MKHFTCRNVGVAMLAAAICLQPLQARAEIVTTDQVVTQSSPDAERAKIQHFLERASVKEKILAMGIGGVAANERVAALNDHEVHAIAEKIDSLPVGGNAGTFTNDQIIIVLLIVLLVLILASA